MLNPTRTIPYGAGPGQSLDDRWTRRQHLPHTGGTPRQTRTPKLSKNLASVKRDKRSAQLDQHALNNQQLQEHHEKMGAAYARRRDRRELNGLNLYEPHQGKRELERHRRRAGLA